MLAASVITGGYLVATFTSTGLAKLRRREVATIGLISEAVIPESLADITVLCLSALELTLAVLIITMVNVFVVGLFAAGLFLIFGTYRMLSTMRTGRISCTCAGGARSSNASLVKIFGTLSASLIQSAIAFAWAFSPASLGGKAKIFLALVAMIPVTAYCVGLIPRRRKPESAVADSSGLPRPLS